MGSFDWLDLEWTFPSTSVVEWFEPAFAYVDGKRTDEQKIDKESGLPVYFVHIHVCEEGKKPRDIRARAASREAILNKLIGKDLHGKKVRVKPYVPDGGRWVSYSFSLDWLSDASSKSVSD